MPDAIKLLHSKRNLLSRLRKDGFNFGSVMDVGVREWTEELISEFPDVPHLLCEPVVEFHDQIQNNYERADIAHTIEPRAISSRTGTADLSVVTMNEGQEVAHSWLLNSGDTAQSVRSIETVTLDQSVSEHVPQAPYLLKIDVDGFELAVIEGAAKTLEKNACGHCGGDYPQVLRHRRRDDGLRF